MPARTSFLTILAGAGDQRGFTLAQVARRLGKLQSYVSMYETGERRLDVVEFPEVAEVISVQPKTLLKRLG